MSGNWRLFVVSRGKSGVLVSWRWFLPFKEWSSGGRVSEGESLEPAEGGVRRRVRISVLKIENQLFFSFGVELSDKTSPID